MDEKDISFQVNKAIHSGLENLAEAFRLSPDILRTPYLVRSFLIEVEHRLEKCIMNVPECFDIENHDTWIK